MRRNLARRPVRSSYLLVVMSRNSISLEDLDPDGPASRCALRLLQAKTTKVIDLSFDIIQSTLNQSKINHFVFIAQGETARLTGLGYIGNIVTREPVNA